ncbi:diguanylate cyclase, partial [Halomonas sp.]|uniref:diguanylate cyclase domain-containing protein n=1 Tax=Halomonas sp. TaxID=1486246 RepID=UPI0025B8EBFA
LAVMHLDLDGFKAVNDGLGHHVGNHLLTAVAERLQHLVQQGDYLARLTGDEFALLLPHLENKQAGIALAERILEALSTPFQIEGKPLHISASIGIACNCHATERACELLQRADLAMAEAKQQGRNTWPNRATSWRA